MIEFQTLEETRINDVVAALEKMHDGSPVSAKRIGEAVGMGHHQTLIYFPMVADEGRAKPVRTLAKDTKPDASALRLMGLPAASISRRALALGFVR